MRKPLALVLTLCVGAWAVGCEGDKPAPPKVPTSDLGAPAKPDSAKSDSAKPTAPAPTTTSPDKK
jgi:hypothetical protein